MTHTDRNWPYATHTVHPTGTQRSDGLVSTIPVFAAITIWEMTGRLIPVMVAREIAAWWHSPGADGSGLAAFSTAGEVTEDLPHNLRRAVASAVTFEDVAALRALIAYVGACTVAPYVVTHNAPGCLPDSADPAMGTLVYADARQAFEDLLREAPEILYGDADCVCGDDELCPPCLTEATVGAILRDGDGPPYAAPDGTGAWERACLLSGDNGPRVFVIARQPMAAADFFAGTGDALPTLTGATVGGAV